MRALDFQGEESSTAQLPDGTYTATTTYATPLRKIHEIETEITIAGNKIVTSAVKYDRELLMPPYKPKSSSGQYHVRFESRYKEHVTGKTLTEAQNVSRIGGASLTTQAFVETLETITQK